MFQTWHHWNSADESQKDYIFKDTGGRGPKGQRLADLDHMYLKDSVWFMLIFHKDQEP